MTELFLIALVAGGVPLGWAFLQRQQAARSLAMTYLRRQCEQQGLQLLDDTVALQGMRLRWAGRPLLVRQYSFEYSADGGDRYPASVTLCGYRPEQLSLGVHTMNDSH
ncbi:MAG: DUF3301 domain-containing protein [Pseudomonadota bacterium]|nr:DUF3301 domain-containing protein [Pseudomonadota bacterium]